MEEQNKKVHYGYVDEEEKRLHERHGKNYSSFKVVTLDMSTFDHNSSEKKSDLSEVKSDLSEVKTEYEKEPNRNEFIYDIPTIKKEEIRPKDSKSVDFIVEEDPTYDPFRFRSAEIIREVQEPDIHDQIKKDEDRYKNALDDFLRSVKRTSKIKDSNNDFSYKHIPAGFMYELGKRFSEGKHKQESSINDSLDEIKKHLVDLELVLSREEPLHFKDDSSDDHLAAIACEIILLYKSLN